MPSDTRVNNGLFAHPKTKKTIRRCGYEGGFRLIHLFAWASANRPDGDLTGMSNEDVELAVDWQGEPGAFTRALVDVGFLDGEEYAYRIHDWQEHNPWAAGQEDRSEAGRWAALCRRYGKIGAAQRMPEYAERLRIARDDSTESSDSHADRSENPAGSRNPLCPVSVPVSVSDAVTDSVSVSDTVSDPSGEVAVAVRPPRRQRATTESKTGPTWNAYAAAYRQRYRVDPVRNAKAAGILSQLVDRLGASEAPEVAAYFVEHKSAYYVQRGHALTCLLADAEKLRMEWATRRQITGTEAKQVEKTQANGDVWSALLKNPGGAHVEQ